MQKDNEQVNGGMNELKRFSPRHTELPRDYPHAGAKYQPIIYGRPTCCNVLFFAPFYYTKLTLPSRGFLPLLKCCAEIVDLVLN